LFDEYSVHVVVGDYNGCPAFIYVGDVCVCVCVSLSVISATKIRDTYSELVESVTLRKKERKKERKE
jgi:hypothetical protein